MTNTISEKVKSETTKLHDMQEKVGELEMSRVFLGEKIANLKHKISQQFDAVIDFEKYDKMTTAEILGPWEFRHTDDETCVAGPCLVYVHELYIEISDDNNYMLTIGNQSWISDVLQELEEILALYLVEEMMTPYCELNG